MPDSLSRRGPIPPGAEWVLLLSLLLASPAGAQELPLKRTLPGADSFSCPELVPGREPGAEEQAQARVLGSTADQALVLGDQERARDLLERAVQLDPLSAELAYRYARILEDLGEANPAIQQFCRSLALGSEGLEIADARTRLDALVRSLEPQIPAQAIAEFSNGLTQFALGNMPEALGAFDAAFQMAPDWADPLYNRGVIRARQGDLDGAVLDLQLYLSLRPDGSDAIAVSQRIGQLQAAVPLPSPSTTLTLGVLIPGMGQFYSGRAFGGFTVLALAGGAAAAGILIEKIETRCVGAPPPGGECPSDRIISKLTTKPYQTPGLIAAGAVTLIGAIEAFIKVRRIDSGEGGETAALNLGGASIRLPNVSAAGARLNLHLVRVTF